MNYWRQSPTNIYVAAHRGWSAKYPENTMAAFKAALELGVDQIETDVRVSKDGELVLFHDPVVERKTNGVGRVEHLTLAELKALKIGNGGQIATFIEFMDLVKDHPTITLDIELKIYPNPGQEELSYSVCDRVLKIVDEYNFTHRCVINSFSAKLHEYIQDTYGNKYKQHVYFPKKLLRMCSRDPYAYAYCVAANDLFDGYISVEDAIEEARQFREETGARMWVGVEANTEENINLVRKMGAELITCNDPDNVLAILRKMHLHD